MRDRESRFADSARGVRPRENGRLTLLPLVAALTLVLVAAPAAHASKNVVGYFGSDGPGIEQFSFSPGSLAINNSGNGPGVSTGDIYVANGSRPAKISQFDSEGNFIRAFGWDVVSSGPDNTGNNEQQTLNVPNTVTAGTFKLIPTVAYGEGHVEGASALITQVGTAIGEFNVGQEIAVEQQGGGEPPIPKGTTITALGPGTLTLSTPVIPNGGSSTPVRLKATETTAPINYNATADTGTGGANLQATLEALNTIGPGGVTVTGGPGASGTPFTVTFTSEQHHLGHNDVPLMKAASQLAGGALSIAPGVEGGGPEVCNDPTVSADKCHNPIEPEESWSRGNIYRVETNALSIDQATGTVFISDADHGRILVFRSDGSFEGGFGWGAVDGAPELELCTNSCREPVGGTGAGQFKLSGGSALAIDPTSGNLYVGNERANRVDEFNFTYNGTGEVSGVEYGKGFGWGVDTGAEEFEVCTTASQCNEGLEGEGIGEIGDVSGLAVDPAGVVYVAGESKLNGIYRVQKFTPSLSSYIPAVFAAPLLDGPNERLGPGSMAIGPGGTILVVKGFPEGASQCFNGQPSINFEPRVLELDSSGTLLDTHLACPAISYEWRPFFGPGHGFTQFGVNSTSGALYLATTLNSDSASDGRVVIADTAVPPTVTIDSLSPNTSGATVIGTVNPTGPSSSLPHATRTSYQLEYRLSSAATWTKFSNPVDIGPGFADHQVTVHLGGVEPNTFYDVRLAGQKPGEATAYSAVETFQTLPVPPTIAGLSSKEVTAHSARLLATINPHGVHTTFHFEYGTTIAYGQQTPEMDAGEAEAFTPQAVQSPIEGLESVVYHFRVVAHNAVGTTASEDQTFTFYPGLCPNASVRQQTGSEYLPDCRAYELVSPAEAGNIVLKSFYRPAPYATNPPRFLYAGFDGAISGTEASNAAQADTYVATRTTEGWKTSYVGIPATQSSTYEFGMGSNALDAFIDFEGAEKGCCEPPYAYTFDETPLGMWPANTQTVTGGTVAYGAFQPSPDFSHLAFSSFADFDPEGNGLSSAPGSAYDYEVASQTTTLISRTGAGQPILQDPSNHNSEERIAFAGQEVVEGEPLFMYPGVSTDGSHILMVTLAEASCSACEGSGPLLNMYMRVNDAVTYDIAPGHAVHYVGMTSDGSKVFFTSNQKLTGDDQDSSSDLYMWSEEKAANSEPPLTDISLGSEGSGNTDECVAGWTSKCDIGLVQGEIETDYPVATDSGDIYFYSPELLDGPENGLEGGRNLYLYRNGHPQFVTRLGAAGSEVLKRIQVSPDGEHAAFLTTAKVTAYDNAGKKEMYSYDASSGALICVSCIPSGEPPTEDVMASVSGLFMSNDGRTFFSTGDALVPRDTDETVDVYEYVNGRPQLISTGTGDVHHRANHAEVPIALMGVDVTGVDVYFSTFDTLVPQDRNGSFLKFYDARAGGGFPVSPVNAPCEAADECHTAGSLPPPAPAIASDGNLGSGGNHRPRRRHHRKHRRHHKKAHRGKTKHRTGSHG